MTGDYADLSSALRSAYDFGSDYPHPRLLAAISAEIAKGQERRATGWFFAGAAAAVLAVLIVTGFLLIPHSSQPVQRVATPSPSFPSNLPPGVCVPTAEQLADPNATRIEAKLVTRETLSTTDPNFHQGWPPAIKYFWVVAEVGVFSFDNIPRPPLPTPSTPKPFHFVLSYLQGNDDNAPDPEWVAHPCRAIGVTANNGAWPAWFDQMESLADVKIR
jgi:hypothetical protein